MPAAFLHISFSHKYVSVEREKESGAIAPDDGQLRRGYGSYWSGVSVLPHYHAQFVCFHAVLGVLAVLVVIHKNKNQNVHTV